LGGSGTGPVLNGELDKAVNGICKRRQSDNNYPHEEDREEEAILGYCTDCSSVSRVRFGHFYLVFRIMAVCAVVFSGNESDGAQATIEGASDMFVLGNCFFGQLASKLYLERISPRIKRQRPLPRRPLGLRRPIWHKRMVRMPTQRTLVGRMLGPAAGVFGGDDEGVWQRVQRMVVCSLVGCVCHAPPPDLPQAWGRGKEAAHQTAGRAGVG